MFDSAVFNVASWIEKDATNCIQDHSRVSEIRRQRPS